MLTQATPPLIKALQGIFPPNAIKQLTQSLGNCNQPLTHRGDINVQPRGPANRNGVAQSGGWNPNDYPDLFPNAGELDNGQFDVAGWSAGDWNNHNYYGDQFFFPTSQEFILNNYYGGPTNNFGGNTFFDNSTHRNINVETINGAPAPGAPGGAPPVAPPAVVAGAPGQDGQDGAGGQGDTFTFNNFSALFQFIFPGGVGPIQVGGGGGGAGRGGGGGGGGPRLTPVKVLTGASFNPDTCSIKTEDTTIYVQR